MYYIFVENGILNGAGQVQIINEEIKNIEVNEDLYNSYIETPLKYEFKNGKIVENADYESIVQKQEIKKRRSEIIEELNNLDLKRIRALCENEMKDSDKNETWLAYYNSKILELRKQLANLEI